MAARPSSHRSIGATQVPDLLSAKLARIELDGLEEKFEVEDCGVCSMSLAKVDAGSGRFERVYLKDIDFGESKLRAVKFSDVIAERIDAANGDWAGAQLRRT